MVWLWGLVFWWFKMDICHWELKCCETLNSNIHHNPLSIIREIFENISNKGVRFMQRNIQNWWFFCQYWNYLIIFGDMSYSSILAHAAERYFEVGQLAKKELNKTEDRIDQQFIFMAECIDFIKLNKVLFLFYREYLKYFVFHRSLYSIPNNIPHPQGTLKF